MDFSDLKEYVTLSKDVVELLKSAYSALPKGAQRNEVERKVKAAEELMRRADVQLAQDLGGRLCHCTWPPQIMLYKQAEGVFQCPNPECNRKQSRNYLPPEEREGRLARARRGR